MKIVKKIVLIIFLSLFIFLIGCIDNPMEYKNENHNGITNCKRYYKDYYKKLEHVVEHP